VDSKGLTMFLNQSVSFATTGSRVLDTCGSFRSSVYGTVRQNGLMYFKPKRDKLALEWGGAWSGSRYPLKRPRTRKC